MATALRLDIKLEIAKLVRNTWFVFNSESQILMNNEGTVIGLDDIVLGT